jgi:hypothetical protein
MAAGRQGPAHDRVGPRSFAAPAPAHVQMPVIPSPVVPGARFRDQAVPAAAVGGEVPLSCGLAVDPAMHVAFSPPEVLADPVRL